MTPPESSGISDRILNSLFSKIIPVPAESSGNGNPNLASSCKSSTGKFRRSSKSRAPGDLLHMSSNSNTTNDSLVTEQTLPSKSNTNAWIAGSHNSNLQNPMTHYDERIFGLDSCAQSMYQRASNSQSCNATSTIATVTNDGASDKTSSSSSDDILDHLALGADGTADAYGDSYEDGLNNSKGDAASNTAIAGEHNNDGDEDNSANPEINVRDLTNAQMKKPSFNLALMTNNFRRFNARIGVIFAFQSRIIRLLLWKEPAQTISFLMVYTIICMNPHLLVLAPFICCIGMFMIPAFLIRYPPPPSRLPTEVYPLAAGPPLAPAPRIRPAGELSMDFLRNMRDLQNAMGDFSKLYDVMVTNFAPLTTFADERKSSVVFIGLSIICMLLLVTGHAVPWRITFLVGGWGVFACTHPLAPVWLRLTQRLIYLPHKVQNHAHMLDSASTTDSLPVKSAIPGNSSTNPTDLSSEKSLHTVRNANIIQHQQPLLYTAISFLLKLPPSLRIIQNPMLSATYAFLDIALSLEPETREVEIFELQRRDAIRHPAIASSSTFESLVPYSSASSVDSCIEVDGMTSHVYEVTKVLDLEPGQRASQGRTNSFEGTKTTNPVTASVSPKYQSKQPTFHTGGFRQSMNQTISSSQSISSMNKMDSLRRMSGSTPPTKSKANPFTEKIKLINSTAHYEPYLFSPHPHTPLSRSRLAHRAPRGSKHLADVKPPRGWKWADNSQWELDLNSRDWVLLRCVPAVEVQVDGERWVWDLDINSKLSGEHIAPCGAKYGVGTAPSTSQLPSVAESLCEAPVIANGTNIISKPRNRALTLNSRKNSGACETLRTQSISRHRNSDTMVRLPPGSLMPDIISTSKTPIQPTSSSVTQTAYPRGEWRRRRWIRLVQRESQC